MLISDFFITTHKILSLKVATYKVNTNITTSETASKLSKSNNIKKKRQLTEFMKSKDSKKTYTLVSGLVSKVRTASLYSKNIKFHLYSYINMYILVSKSNETSKIRFTNFSNISNMYLIDTLRDGDCFFYIIYFLARLNW